MNFKKEIKKLEKKFKELNRPEFTERQHQKGKLTARERINLLLDKGSFVELDPFVFSRFDTLGLKKKKVLGDAVITGFGKIDGRQVFIYSQDFSKMGGSLGEMHGEKIVKVIRLAFQTGRPIIGIIDSGGARIQEGVASLDGYAKIFREMVKASGVIPQICVLAGPSVGGASYAPGLSDFIFMIEGISQMFITGPDVIEEVTKEKVSFEELGGATVHALKSGCTHFVFSSEKETFEGVKTLLSYLPLNNLEDPPEKEAPLNLEPNEKLIKIVPEDEKKGYEMREVIGEIFDKDSFFEVQAGYAKNSIIGFARLAGKVVGIIANQTKDLAGTLDIDSSDKVARFIRFCDCFNIPLISLVDTPGYLPGKDQEYRGIIRHGAKVLFAYAEASVPKISVILRKAFGGAYIALASKKLGFDFTIAWPSAQIAVMGPEQAVRVIFKKELKKAKNPKKLKEEKVKEFRKIFLDIYQCLKLGQIDMIVDPRRTREILIKSLEGLLTKREGKIPKKHGNIPL